MTYIVLGGALNSTQPTNPLGACLTWITSSTGGWLNKSVSGIHSFGALMLLVG